MSDGEKLRSLEETPTWSVAVVCFILVVISIFIEHLLHLLGKYLMKNNKRSLYESFEKVKSELMLLGFISLLLTVIQNPIAEICVSEKVANSWQPCKNPKFTKQNSPKPSSVVSAGPPRRKLLGTGAGVVHSFRRVLAAGEDKCAEKGKVAFMSTYAIHQLHIFIFVLAVCHILYCILTMILGRLKMKKWKAWERETRTVEFQFLHDPERFRFARETSFGRRHLNFWSKSPVLIWIVCFFRQLVTSVSKVDYMTLRHGFIMAHLAPQSSTNFNFLRYIKKSLEDDFQVVVGISPLIWFFAVLFLLFNTQGWFSYFWLPFIPLLILLLVGTKLQVIITKMALKIMEHGDVIKGFPVVEPTDNLFWFNRPKLLLHLIHFVLFENAFQIAFFLFSWYKFGLHSCFHEETEDILIRITMGIITQILCSYVTLPLYALVTQMGSSMKPVIFNDRVATALKHWHATAKRHLKENRKSGTGTPSTSQPPTPSHSHSPIPLLRRFQSHESDDNTNIDSRTHTPKNHSHDNVRFDPDESVHPAEGGSSHNPRRGKSRVERSGDHGDQLDVVGVGIGGGVGSPRHVMPSIQISEEDRKQIAINFSFDKRMLEEGKQ